MTYIEVIWSEKWKVYERKEISQKEATKTLKRFYKDTSFIGSYQFRLKIPNGWIQTATKEDLVPQPGFFGVCGEWEPEIVEG